MIDGVYQGERAWIARAITLVESTKPEHRQQARELLAVLGDSKAAVRLGVSGVPGAGKSTFIEAFGTYLTGQAKKVGVLTIDPSSQRTGGSILGDKTRMAKLAIDPRAFIRPSPSGGHLGGVARATRESMVILEAAGFDVIIVETVGVGQSEYAVADMVDTFLLLMVARTGDNLQGIKRGILELSDIIAVNKADGDNVKAAQRSARELSAAMRMLRDAHDPWQTPVLTCSALEATGIEEIWQQVRAQRDILIATGSLNNRRRDQNIAWMHRLIKQQLIEQFYSDEEVGRTLRKLEKEVSSGNLDPYAAAKTALELPK